MVTNLKIVPYHIRYKTNCLGIFDSNCPPYFDASEKTPFSKFLDSLQTGIPVYPSIQANHFFVVIQQQKLVGCGGYYTVTNQNQIRLSWGMVHKKLHHKKIGQHLTQYRIQQAHLHYPNYNVALDTSQHTVGFYQKMGFQITRQVENGYAPGLHKFEMESRKKITKV